jgi:beta-glucanase (GH16 family)
LDVSALRTVAILACAAALQAQTVSREWILTFADEFSGKSLDLARWSPNDPLRRGQAQHPEAVSVSDGMLHIAANGLAGTYGLFSQAYGRFEIRCRIAGGHPRFALLPIPAGTLPSIEILPFVNRWGSEQTERSYGGESDLPAGTHTIVMQWERDSIIWFVDGKMKFQSADGVPHQPMYILLDGPADIDYIRVYTKPAAVK